MNLVLATHPEESHAAPMAKRYVRYGASPRGAQTLILAAKIFALLDGRYHVAKDDIAQNEDLFNGIQFFAQISTPPPQQTYKVTKVEGRKTTVLIDGAPVATTPS